MNRIEFIAEQLRAISPGVEWNVSGIDRSIELARILDRNGILDLWRLKLVPVEWIEHVPETWIGREWGDEWIPPSDVPRQGYAFDYMGKRIGYMGSPTEPANEIAFQNPERGQLVAWSAEGHGHVGYLLSVNKQTGKLQIQPVWESSSDAADIRMAAITFISFFAFTALPLGGISVGNAIGSAVLPASVSAAYPALTTAIGNIALSTALSGGDIEQAVKNTLISSVTAGLGDVAGAQIGSEYVGKLAAAGANAAIRGDDVKQAIGFAALRFGATGMDELFSLSDIGGEFNPQQSFFGTDFNTTIPAFEFDWNGVDLSIDPVGVSLEIPYSPDQFFGAVDVLPVDTTALGDNPVTFDPFVPNPFLDSLPIDANTGNPVVPPVTANPNSQTWSPTTVIKDVTAATLAVLQVVKAYKSLDAPTIQSTARVARPDGSVSVIGNNGLVQTRRPDGTIVATRPPVGVPQATLTGDYVTNNGNGTFTVVSPTGQSRVLNYAATGGGSSDSSTGTLALLGVGALLFLGSGGNG